MSVQGAGFGSGDYDYGYPCIKKAFLSWHMKENGRENTEDKIYNDSDKLKISKGCDSENVHAVEKLAVRILLKQGIMVK